MGAHDVILVMDADSQINDGFLKSAADYFQQFPELDAVGGVFFGESGHGLLGQFQRNEYTRYSDQIKRRGGRVFVLTGTASLFRAQALSAVAKGRGIYIPGTMGQVYDTAALTEDNELTIALKTMGSPMISPPECQVTTELMPTWKNLWVQRLRWQRGAIENLGAYGFTRTTMRYWGQQIGIAYGTIALFSAMALSLFMFLAQDHWVWYTFWLAVGLVFTFERVWTVRKGGRAAILLALPVFLEIAFDIFLQLVFIKVLIDAALVKKSSWGHVKHPISDRAKDS
jgi:cellulose synthase/poly-beta-1,6-N-acetylglucosamine synthase-like glycosyltransferase